MDQHTHHEGVTRRDLLKRGAALGGAIAWMTPIVQTVGMSPAFGQTELVSPGGDRCLRLTVSAEPPPAGATVNRRYFVTEVCNCGVFEVTGIILETYLAAVSIDGGSFVAPVLDGIYPGNRIQVTNVGALAPVDGAQEDCSEQHFDIDIRTMFATNLGVGQTVALRFRAVADDSFGPVEHFATFAPYTVA